MEQRWAELARTLRELGRWQHLSGDAAAEAERAVAAGGYPFGESGGDHDVRRFWLDSETMAEGGVGRVLREMAPALRTHGVDLRVEVVTVPLTGAGEGDYIVSINGRRCAAWTRADRAADCWWESATVRPLAVVNDLLAEAGARVRLFALYVGTEDALAWLVDPRIVAAVADSGLFRESDVPLLAAHDTVEQHFLKRG
ncbi:hypothetical protein ACWT_5271 [Actinoplanes sp. SE50]|uniref:hypothetical protein n=1 Tax=unclassified Actinoplanes TaxID=2626549 RepID=UPI00023EBF6E|nr:MULTISPECIES: hypothetical protein [unclassified Actinoplanes]AEV86289.1 hypothetical protein ACPL_5402 [Actinoplanes sp. SE50/110]ATO84686.1 hypothetical protein ACWT_5271 [Actinoplanes sp. SE50]SLM02096.1 hypothetical protein ACSP50_5334 [Actinoplanes sp. SE50/110]